MSVLYPLPPRLLNSNSPTVLKNVPGTRCPVAVCWPAGYITQDAVVEEDVLLAIGVDLERGDAGGVVVDHHDAGAVETLGLVNEQVAALVVHVVSNDKALWREEEWFEVEALAKAAGLLVGSFILSKIEDSYTVLMIDSSPCKHFHWT